MATSPAKSDVLVRVHSHCVYGDIFHSLDCDCHHLIPAALEAISRADCGVLIYLHQTGPGIQAAWRDGRHELDRPRPRAIEFHSLRTAPALAARDRASARRFFPILGCPPSTC